MNPFSILTGLLGKLVPSGGATGTNITFTPEQYQALLKAIETFGPMLAGVSPTQMAVAEELLTAFGYGNLIPKA